VLLAACWQLDGPEDTERSAEHADAAAATASVPGDTRPDVEGARDADGAIPTNAPPAPPVASAQAPQDSRGGVRQAVRTAPWLLLGLAAIPMMSGAVEDSAASWAAVYLRDTLDATAFVAGLGFVAAQAMMVVGRVTGDRLVDRFGAARVARAGSLLAAVGMLAVVTGTSPAVVVAGFGLSGLGVATLFPLGLAAAGEIPGVRSADGVAVAAWLARLSFLVVPPVVGLVADAAGLRWGLAMVFACALIAAALSGLLPDDTRR
jgi:fucose permease